MSIAEAQRQFVLPGGYVDDGGTRHRDVELAALTGREEELLATVRHGPTAAVVTEVLSRCVLRIGSIRPVPPEVARHLLVADRQFLLLRLRELTFGDRVFGTLSCPWPGCAAKVDIDFSTRDIPVRDCDRVAPSYQVELSTGPTQRTLTFRLPHGGDQEEVGPLVATDPGRALTALLQRCVIGVEPAGVAGTEPEPPDAGVDEFVAGLDPRARRQLEAAMEASAPAVDLDMELACPECGRGFTAPFDLTDFFLGELGTSRDLLYRQVHYLAYHYHWSEREILELPQEKRLAYIDILTDEIEAINRAV